MEQELAGSTNIESDLLGGCCEADILDSDIYIETSTVPMEDVESPQKPWVEPGDTPWIPAEQDVDSSRQPDASADASASSPGSFDDGVWGEPSADVEYWLPQKYNGWCAPSSVAQVVAEFSGAPLESVDAVVERAISMGFLSYNPSDPQGHPFDGWSGMSVANTEALLESYGIPATTTTGSMDTLAQLLEGEHSVMVPVDSSEVWTGVEDGAGGSDHMLVVTGIDAVNGVVYMNDPFLPDGAGRAVPYSVFESAWADSGYTMIVTETPAPAPAGGADLAHDPVTIDLPPVSIAGTEPLHVSPWALLPITLSARAWDEAAVPIT